MTWTLVGLGGQSAVAASSITLAEPAGAAAGDLLIAGIGFRLATPFTLPPGWQLVDQHLSASVAETSGESSGLLAYIVRGATAPGLTFTRADELGGGAIGEIVAYRNTAAPTLLGSSAALGQQGQLSKSMSGISVSADDALLVFAGFGETAWRLFGAATDPATEGSAAGVVDTTTQPTAGVWIERRDATTTLGHDTGLALADAVKATAGDTGDLYVTASSNNAQPMIAAAFAVVGSTPVSFSGSVANQTGTEGTAFSLDLSTYFSGSETPFAYSVQAGTLPAGLSLNSSTGVISGTPTTAGVSSGIVIRATDATPDTADTNGFSITINAANTSPSFTGPSIDNISGTEGVALTPLDVSARFFDAESSLTFSAVGTWPAGVTVSSAGVISGTPTTAGTYASLQVRATDAGSLTADSNAFTITVAAPGDAENPTLTGSVTFASITQTSYTANWPAGLDNAAVTGYEYQIGGTGGAWTDAGDNLSAAITGRTAGTTETVYVRAYDAAGLRSTPAISGEVTLLAAVSGITVTEPLKNNTGTLLASQSGVRVAVLQAAELVSVYETTGLTTNGAGILATISDAAITAGQQYHVAIKLADGGVGITGPITAS